jgi:hypothetical protein
MDCAPNHTMGMAKEMPLGLRGVGGNVKMLLGIKYGTRPP